MNQIRGIVREVIRSGNILQVITEVSGDCFTALLLDSGEDFFQKDSNVFLVFKETELSVAKSFSGHLSIRNRFKGTVMEVNKGKILTEIKFNYKGFNLSAIITSAACEEMLLTKGDVIEALLKSNELMLMKDNHGI